MIKSDFFGHSVDVIEHIAELKNKFKYEGYFNRFYNKKQMFKFFLGRDVFVSEDGDRQEEEIDDFPCRGRYVNCSYKGCSDSVCIEFYRVSDLCPDSDLVEDFDWYNLTFIQDDAGKCWIIKIDED